MDNIKELKLTITGTLAAVFYLIGWQGVLFLLLAGALIIDYVTGSIAARNKNEWESKKATIGRLRKALVFVAIITAVILDSLIFILMNFSEVFQLSFSWPYIFTFISTVWFLLSEIGSTLENLAIIGLNLPDFLIKGVKVLKGRVETVGDQLIKKEENEND